jgi:enediyne biosynthesis protein CalE5
LPGSVRRHLLDVATGYGEPALTAARVVGPNGRVVATDIAPDLLGFGRERAARAGLNNIDFVAADAETLTFAEEEFDAVVSRQGLQFLPDVVGTVRRLHRFLKRDGRPSFAVWGPPSSLQFARPVSLIVEELELASPSLGTARHLCACRRRPAHPAGRGRRIPRRRDRDSDCGLGDSDARADDRVAPCCGAPHRVNLLSEQSPEVRERIWRHVTESWAPLTTTSGSVRTENQAIWLAAKK